MAVAKKQFKVKNTCKGVIPFWVNDVVGKDNYKKLQKGETVSLPSNLQRGIFEFLIPVAKVSKKTASKKKDKK